MNSKVTVAIVNWHNLLVWMTLIIHIENYLHTRNGLEFNVKKVTKTHSKVCNLSHFAVIPCESATFLLLLFFAHDGTEHLWSAFEQLLVFHSRKQQLLIHRSARRKHLLLFICSMRNANKTRNRRQFMLKWIGIVCRVRCRLTIHMSRMEFLQLQCVQYGIRSSRGARNEPDQQSSQSEWVNVARLCANADIESTARRTQHVVCCSSNLLLL